MEQLVKDNFTLLLTVSVVTTVIAAAASIVYRVAKVKGSPSIPEHEILFTESWASGASQKNVLTKLGEASNCLRITLSRNALVIRPMFPINLMFLPEVFDLEHVIPRNAIKNIDSAPNGRNILVEFESQGISKRFELTLRKREEFLLAIDDKTLSRGRARSNAALGLHTKTEVQHSELADPEK